MLRVRYVGHHPRSWQLDALLHGRDGGIGRDLDQKSARVLAAARRRVGRDSGRLLASGRREHGRTEIGQHVDVTFGVRGLTRYLGYHMDGTRPHIIRARRGRALRFVSGGQLRFARQVRHPGTRANPFLVEALREAVG